MEKMKKDVKCYEVHLKEHDKTMTLSTKHHVNVVDGKIVLYPTPNNPYTLNVGKYTVVALVPVAQPVPNRYHVMPDITIQHYMITLGK